MWARGGGVTDEDRLDRAETGRVLRRSMQFARPYRRTIWLAVLRKIRRWLLRISKRSMATR